MEQEQCPSGEAAPGGQTEVGQLAREPQIDSSTSLPVSSSELSTLPPILGYVDTASVKHPPPPEYYRPGRGQWTNQLKYLLNHVIKPIFKLKCALSFKQPVDPILLHVPNYYDVITNPMDLGTIKKRLENNYYVNAQECIDDMNQMLSNCYTFNKPDHFVYTSGKDLERQFKVKMQKMPAEEVPISMPVKPGTSPRKPFKGNNRFTPAIDNAIDALSSHPLAMQNSPQPSGTKVEYVDASQSEAQINDRTYQLEIQIPVSDHSVGTSSTKTEVSESGTLISPIEKTKLEADSDYLTDADQTSGASPLLSSSVCDDVDSTGIVTQSGMSDFVRDSVPHSPANTTNSGLNEDDEEPVHSTISDSSTASHSHVSCDGATSEFERQPSIVLDKSEISPLQVTRLVPPICPRPPYGSQPAKTKKGVKRKADTTTPNTPPFSTSEDTYARTSNRKIKRPNKELPGEDEPFSKGFKKPPLTGPMRFCYNLLKEMLGKQHYEYAWPFYQPVDVVELNLTDYYDKIKQPMDLGTVKKKMDERIYKNPADFASDVRLIFSNCYKYNPSDIPVYQMAQKLHNVFETKFAKLPARSVSPSHSPSNVYRPSCLKSPSQKKKGSLKNGFSPNENGFRQNGKMSSKNNLISPNNGLLSGDQSTCGAQPELHAINKLQEQLSLVMQQLSQIQQQGIGRDAKEKDVKKIRQQIDSLTGEPKKRAPKRQRKKNPDASAQNNASADLNGAPSELDSATIPTSSAAASESLGPGKLPDTTPSASSSNVSTLSNLPTSLSSAASSPVPKTKKEQPKVRKKQTSADGESPKKQSMKKSRKPARPPGAFDSDEEDNARPMTYDEKRKLSTDIDKLSSDKLTRLVHIIREHEPSLRDTNVSEIVVDLEAVKASTLRALERFVSNCLRNTKKTAAKAPPRKPSPVPIEDIRSRQEALERKIEQLGGKKTKLSYERELAKGMNIDPVSTAGSKLSDSSSSEDSDSSSDGSSDSDGNASSDESGQERSSNTESGKTLTQGADRGSHSRLLKTPNLLCNAKKSLEEPAGLC